MWRHKSSNDGLRGRHRTLTDKCFIVENEVNKIKEIMQTEWFRIQLMFRADPGVAALDCALNIIACGLPLVSAFLWKALLDAFAGVYYTREISAGVWLYLGVFLGVQLISSPIILLGNRASGRLGRKASHTLDIMVMRKIAEVDMGFFDDPKNQDALEAARMSECYISGAATSIFGYIADMAALISAAALFLAYNWLAGLLFLVTYIPGALLSYRQKKALSGWMEEEVPYEREKDYFKSILTREYFAKELRLYNLAGRFRKKYADMWERIQKGKRRIYTKNFAGSILFTILSYGGLAGVVFLSVRSVLAGEMTVGTLVMFVELARTCGSSLSCVFDAVSFEIAFIHPQMLRFNKFINYENTVKSGEEEEIGCCPDVEFRNVWFRYPGSRDYVLKDFSVKIESGKKIALIGVNGAGKSTVVKLLLHFYEPEKGCILIGGKEIREYSPDALYRFFGVCFQDVARYALTIKENIALSDINRTEEEDRLRKAVAAASAEEMVAKAPHGYDTELTRELSDQGEELSGGQWQKLGIARAYFRQAGMVILDEPSSALDPEAEDHIFSSFHELCKGRSGLLISHRLSSIMMVDEIVVLEQGAVIEQGSHGQLIARNGRYAMLYRMQAEKYKGGRHEA